MAKDLVIVESPAKARTIARFLGNSYDAKASMGHVRDLPRKDVGVSVEDKSFQPKYTVPADKRKIVSELAKAAKVADTVYLATDPDREGEAISWHLIKAAKIDESKVKRVVFHEITKDAVQHAFDNPRDLDYHLIDAQQARRVLDRLVGYDLSPVLWKKVRKGLSAGRVQSVALRLIVERQMKIDSFTPEEYWSIEGQFAKLSDEVDPTSFSAKLRVIEGKKGKLHIPNGDKAQHIIEDLLGSDFLVDSVINKERRNRPAAPFITSTLQQEAWRKLRMTSRRSMVIAQQLYEGISLGDQGSVGLITYMRTDSTTVSQSALAETRVYVKQKFGPQYLPKSPRLYTKKVKGAQEAHEAIRPTSIDWAPDSVKKYLSKEQFQLYGLIWRRMVASQMADVLFDSTTVDIVGTGLKSSAEYKLRATGSVLKFPGFRRVYMEDRDDSDPAESDETRPLPSLISGESLTCPSLTPEQHFTEPPPRYTEATLIREMEEQGIGRPSTYAPTIATVMDRDYVRKDQGRFVPTKLGTAVNGLLTAHFPDIIDVGFTARIEEELDDIASGEREWAPVLQEFHRPFSESVEKAMKEAERVPRDQIDEESDEVCDACGRSMVIKMGRFGRFLSCSGFPECRNSQPLLERVGVECPEDGGDLVERRQKGKRGRRFYGCANYPTCKFVVSQKPLAQSCPQCSKLLVVSGRSNAKCTSCEFRGPVPEEELVELAS